LSSSFAWLGWVVFEEEVGYELRCPNKPTKLSFFLIQQRREINESKTAEGRKVKPFHSILFNEWSEWNWFHFFSSPRRRQQFKRKSFFELRQSEAPFLLHSTSIN